MHTKFISCEYKHLFKILVQHSEQSSKILLFNWPHIFFFPLPTLASKFTIFFKDQKSITQSPNLENKLYTLLKDLTVCIYYKECIYSLKFRTDTFMIQTSKLCMLVILDFCWSLKLLQQKWINQAEKITKLK